MNRVNLWLPKQFTIPNEVLPNEFIHCARMNTCHKWRFGPHAFREGVVEGVIELIKTRQTARARYSGKYFRRRVS